MIRNDSRSGSRSAFTLVELLVVVLIIAILVSLIGSAVLKAMQKIPEVQTRTEIAEMSVALQAFMSDYNLTEPPPSLLYLNEYTPLSTPQDNGRSAAFLQKVFGKNLGVGQVFVDWNGDGVASGPSGGMPWVLQGEQCLTFYLGGIPNVLQMKTGAPPAPLGFSTNNTNPAMASAKRKGPYFNFVTPRLFPQTGVISASWNGFFVYLDPWQSKAGPLYATMGGSPYAFFSSGGINNGYALTSAFNAAPYAIRSGVSPYALTGQFTNPNTFQIISAGKDGVFGNTGWVPTAGMPPVPFSNANAANQPAGDDDQANFSGGLLGAGQQ